MMAKIIQLSHRKSSRPHVEILDGIVTGTVHHSSAGAHFVTDHMGEHWFFVDLVEADQSRLSLWSGNSHGAAIIEAETAAIDFAASVRDRVGGAHD